MMHEESALKLHHFTSRVIETEEVWGLGESAGWLLKEQDNGDTHLLVWPHKDDASEMATGDLDDHYPMAVSLDHFMFQVLEKLKAADYMVEIDPTPEKSGEVISAHKLFDMLEGMVDAGEYYMEG